MLDLADKAGNEADAKEIYQWIQETPDEAPAPVAPVAAPAPVLPQAAPKVPPQQRMDELKQFVNKPGGPDLKQPAFHGLQRASKGLLDTADTLLGPVAIPFKGIHKALVEEAGMPSIYPTEQNLAAGEAATKAAGLPGALAAGTTEAFSNVLPTKAAVTSLAPAASYYLPKAFQAAVPATSELLGNMVSGATMAPSGEKGQAAVASGLGTGFASAIGQGYQGLVGLGKKAAKTYLPEFMPTKAAATERASQALQEKYGQEEFKRMGHEIDTQMGPHMLPQTTASLTGSKPAAAYERGARTRPTFGANEFDESVNKAKGGIFQNITQNAENVPKLAPVPQAIHNKTQEALNKIPLDNKSADKITIGLDDMKKGVAFGSHPADAKRASDWINTVLLNKNTTIGHLHQLRTNLNESGMNPGVVEESRAMLKKVIDEATGGKLTATNLAAGQAKDKLKAAQATQALRDRFTYAGKFKPEEITEKSLDTAMDVEARKSAADKFPYIDESMLGGLKSLSEASKKHELYKGAQGAPSIQPSEAESVLSAGLDAGSWWKFRKLVGTVFSGYKEATVKAADEAARHPDKFLEMVQAKRAAGQALEEWEKKMEGWVQKGTRAGGVAGAEGGKVVKNEYDRKQEAKAQARKLRKKE